MVVMIVQLCEYTQNHRTIHFEGVRFMVCESHLNFFFKCRKKLGEKIKGEQERRWKKEQGQTLQDLLGHPKDLAFTLREPEPPGGFEQGRGVRELPEVPPGSLCRIQKTEPGGQGESREGPAVALAIPPFTLCCGVL